MAFDPVIANPGRLSILTVLAVDEQQEFVQLRTRTGLTDGNLACHARKLQAAGMLRIEKSSRAGKSVTSLTLLPEGRLALERHVRRVLSALSARRVAAAA